MKLPSKGAIVSAEFDGVVRVGRVEDVLFAESDPAEAELFIRFSDGDAAWIHHADLRTSVVDMLGDVAEQRHDL